MHLVESRSWLIPIGIGMSILASLMLRRWWPIHRRQNRVNRLRNQAKHLAHRIKESTKETSKNLVSELT